MNPGGPLCDTTNLPKSPAALLKSSGRVSKTYKRAPGTAKMTVAALATTLEKAAELETIKAKASVTPTRQKRKRDNLRALDTDNEVKMLQEYFKDVDQCVLEEDVKLHSTPRKEVTSTRAPWLTPEEKPRGKVRPLEWARTATHARPQPQKENMFSTPEIKRTHDVPEKEMQQVTTNLAKAIFATPEPKPRAGRKPATHAAHVHQHKEDVLSTPEIQRTHEVPEKDVEEVATNLKNEIQQVAAGLEKEIFATPEAKSRPGRKRRAQAAQEHAGPSPVRTQVHAQRTYSNKLRRVR
eukprot:Phypoly_transcript_12909.p1 GENE.Phypoly_transcript_12909~~Phypoly_transcript_12909.p1  ORF type:complete len:295 (-),score=87.82 Phypoly_transcript_12909:174-1058(-)